MKKAFIFIFIILQSIYSQSSFEISCKKCREEVSKCIDEIGYNSCKESIASCNKVCTEYIKERGESKTEDEKRREIENTLFFYDSEFYKSLTDTQRILYEHLNRAIEEHYQKYLLECIKKNEKVKEYVDNFNLINHYCVIEKLQDFNKAYNMYVFNNLMFDLKIEESQWKIASDIIQSILCDLAAKHP